MKFLSILFTLLALCAAFAFAADQLESVVVSYQPSTPEWVLQKAKDAIRKAGGMVTHEYKFLKGYAAELPKTLISNVNAASVDILGTPAFPATIEKDTLMHAWNPDDDDKKNGASR